MNGKVLGLFFTCFIIGICGEKFPQWNPPPFQGKSKSSSRVKRSSQCYGDLGCFSNAFPFNNTGEALPLNPRFINTRFYLYSSINQMYPQVLNRRILAKLRRSRYNSNLPTKFVIHGFLQHGLVNWTAHMAKSLIRKEPTNVVVVDWGRGSGWPYTQAAANTRVVGREIAKMIQFLIAETGGDLSKFHLIGHSLGAHVAGYVGEALPGLGRITGLDPAEPNFKNADIRSRLDPGDANLVDVIHTDGSAFDEISGFGLLQPVGDIDFYPNGGENQPGCPRENLVNIFSESYHYGFTGTEDLLSCSHSRSIHLFIESINSDCHFTAYPCDDFAKFRSGECLDCRNHPCPIMGLSANKYESFSRKPRGQFYLTTGKSTPYCGHAYGIEVHLSTEMQPTEGLLQVSFHDDFGHIANHTVYSDDFQPSQVYKDILLSPDDLSSVTGVTIRFFESSQIWSWIWAGSIKIKEIVMIHGHSPLSKHFCGRDVTINSGSSTVLTPSVC